MGFSSMDNFISKTTIDQQQLRIDWQKNFLTAVAIAGEWHCMANGLGNPAGATIFNTGTNLAFQALYDTTTNASPINHGGNVSPATKHIINMSAYSAAATSAPCMLMLVDMLGFYRVTSVTTITSQALDNTVTIPRYTDGKGVRAFAFVNSTTAMGAATPTLTMNYNNTSDVAKAGSNGGACKTGATAGHIMYSGTGTGKYNPFLPLAQGDIGIKKINSIQLSASYVSGEFSVVLCKPIVTIPIAAVGVASERDLMSQMPSMPQIKDGACLQWLLYSGAATPASSSYIGHFDVAWA